MPPNFRAAPRLARLAARYADAGASLALLGFGMPRSALAIAWGATVVAILCAQRAPGQEQVEPASPLDNRKAQQASPSGEAPAERSAAEPDVMQPRVESLNPAYSACPHCGQWHAPDEPCPGETLPFRLFRSSNNSPRYTGWGEPLEGTSWLNRPFSVGLFLGVMSPDDWINNRVQPDSDLVGGIRLGWDSDHYWGLEGRFAWFSPTIHNVGRLPEPRSGDLRLADLSILYYPWGDSVWRPYLTAGLGVAEYEFSDDLGVNRSLALLEVPFGGGLKYFWSPSIALRGELIDNVSVGDSGLAGQNSVSFTLGLEYRYGGPRPSYYPWHPSRHIW